MNRQSLHKFGAQYRPHLPSKPPVGVLYYPFEDLKYPHVREDDIKWNILSQEELKLSPNTASRAGKTLTLQFGVKLALGVVLISLTQELKAMKCSLSNESVVEDVENIIIVLHNNSDKEIVINEGEIFCHLTHVNT